jgi:hypothetical protein
VGGGNLGLHDTPPDTSPLLHSMVSGEDAHGLVSPVTDASSAGGNAPVVGGLARAAVVERQDSDDLPIDVDDLYGAYY